MSRRNAITESFSMGRAAFKALSPSVFIGATARRAAGLIFASLLTGCGLLAPPTPYLVTLTPAPTRPASPTAPPTATTQPTGTPLATAVSTAAPPPTEPPTPEPTKDPWPPALSQPGASKMGIHVLLNDDPRIMEFIRRVKPRVVKALDNLDWLADVKQVSPATITIGRYTQVPNRNILDGKDPSQYPNPDQFARDFINTFIDQYRAHPSVNYWEGWNEFPPNSPAQWQWYAAFEAARACQMRDLGLGAAVGGFSAGTPEFPDMERFLPAIRAVKECGGIFTLHEYSSPVMQFGVNSGIPNAVHVNNAGSLTLRYRYWYEGYLKPQNLVVPLVISEAGVDSNVGAGCPKKNGGQGWYACYNDWQAMGLGGEHWRTYMNQLQWYDSELRKDDYVIGFTIFTAGTSKVQEWRTFDIDDLLIPMAVYMASQ